MEIVTVIVLSLVSLVTLFILTKLIGNREMSQLSMFDYINSITIGSIAAEMATDLENFERPLTAMITYTLAIMLISYITSKSLKARRIVTGKTLRLFDNGKIYYNNLKRAHIDLGEFLTQCRVAGYFDLSKLQTILLEPNGKMSFLPKASDRPASPKDLSIAVDQEFALANVILDGQVLHENLDLLGFDEVWLQKELSRQHHPDISKVFLATCDKLGTLRVYLLIEDYPKHDVFE